MGISVAVGLAVAGAAAAAAATTGAVMSEEARKEAEKSRQKALKMYEGMATANYEDTLSALKELRSKGLVTPQVESAVLQADSEMRYVTADPSAVEAQQASLQYLQEIRDSGGLTDMDKQHINEAQDQILGINQAQRAATQQAMAARGVGGSGLELASQLSNQQASTQELSRQLQGLEALAQQRRDQANQGAAALATNIRGQKFSEDAAKAQAQDLINRFNAGQLQGVMSRNADRQLQADTFNTNFLAQNISQEAAQEQQKFENELALMDRRTGTVKDIGDINAQAKRDQGAAIAQGAQGVGQAGTSLASYGASTYQQPAKKA